MALLQQSQTGKLYEARLRKKEKEIDAIPEGALERNPYAAELASTDVAHDALGMATHYLCLAIEAHPKLPASLKDKAQMVKERFVPQPSILRRSYADEAAAALKNRPMLTDNEAKLKTVKTPEGGTLYAWVNDFLDAGDALDKLLRDRALALATGESAAGTAALRAATVGLLGRFRDALRDEIDEENSSLPADHEATLFAYIDKLSADRTAAAERDASQAAKAEAAKADEVEAAKAEQK